MKKFLLLSFSILLFTAKVYSQCACAATNYASVDVNCWVPGQSATITTCQYGGERATILNTVAGAVYRISSCGAGYDTQLSIYTTSCAFVAYNDDNGPACGGTASSVQFTSPGGDLYSVLNQYYCSTNTTCTGISIQMISMPVPTMAFGTNSWNVHALQHGGYNFNDQMNLTNVYYKGFYNDGNLNITSTNRWGTNDSPSFASGWSGCSVGSDNHVVVYKRQGFPCGEYEIDLNTHDDGVRCYVNGLQVYQLDGCCADRGIIYRGYLDASSTVEFRVSEGGGGSNLQVNFNPVNPLTASASYASAAGCNKMNITVSNANGGACNWISTNFSAALPSTQLNGSAAYTGGGCRLTPNSGGQYGSFAIDNPNAFNASDVNLNYDFFFGNGGGADGMSISYGAIAMNSNNGEAGSGSNLIIRMVTYSGAGPKVQLVYGGVVLETYNSFPWRGAQRACSMSIVNGYLTYVIAGTTVFSNVDLGAAYRNADKSSWRWVFAARTGGVSDDHYIYNLHITAKNYEYSIGSGWQSSNVFSNLDGGNTYTVQVRPKCTTSCATTIRTISLPNMNPILSATPISPTCNGLNNGSIDLSVSGAIHGARVVKIVQLDNEPFNTNEILAIQAGTGVNVALASNGGVPEQSSSLNPSLYPVAWLNDGNFHNGVGAHTNTGVGQWQRVYWEEPVSLESIQLWNRDDCCDYRLDNIRIEIYGDVTENNLLFSQVVNANNGVGTSYTFNPVNAFSNPTNTFAWSNGASTEDISNLAPGSYNVSVTTANSCVVTLNGITVPSVTALSLSATTSSSSCSASADGSINLSVSNAQTSALPPAFSNLAVWTKGDAGVVKNKEGQVIQWQDLSGNDNHFYTTYGNNVQEVNGAINGQKAIRFNAQNIMETGNVVPGNYTVIVVAKMNSGANNRLVSSGSTNWLLGWWGGRVDQFYSQGWVHNPGTGVNQNTYIYTGTGDIGADSYSLYRNGSLLATNNAGSTAPGSISLGGWGTGNTELSNGDVAEVIVYNKVLSANERRALEYYLAQKYGVAGPTAVSPSFSWSNGASTEDISALTPGSYTVNVTDASGCSANASYTVNNGDVTPPTITCPANIVVSTSVNACSANVSYATPTFSDNCSGATISRIAGLASGSSFSKGVSTVTYRATDSAGNTSDCSFTITVNDTQAPTISCPSNITVFTTAGSCGANVSYATPTRSDNCPGVTAVRISGPSSGSFFNLGITTVTWRATDAAGLTSDCSFTVEVLDNIPPTINCPANITVNTDPGTCSALVNYSTPTYSDNCAGVSIARTLGLPSGSSFPKGVSTITYRATDAAGNITDCSFTVTVIDNIPPSITCPSNITVNNDVGLCGAVVDYSTNFSLTLNPTDDAHVNSTTPSTNFGTSSLMNVDRSTQNTFLKFDLSSIPSGATITSAVLEMTVNDGFAWGGDGNVYNTFVADDSWTESSINWTNQPSATTALGYWWQWCDATSCLNAVPKVKVSNSDAALRTQVQTEINGDGTLSIRLNSPGYYTQYFSKEHASAAERPNLVINYSLGVPNVSDNCTGMLSLTQTAGLASGDVFPVGTTTNTFLLTDASGLTASCSFDVIVNELAPTTAAAGNDQYSCLAGDVSLAANSVAAGESGTWTWSPNTVSYVSGNASSANAVVNFAGTGTYTGTWTISNACGTQSSDDLVIEVNKPDVVTLNAGATGTCTSIGENEWVHLYDAGNNIIASVNDLGQAMGDVTVSVPTVGNASPSNVCYNGMSAYMGRFFSFSASDTAWYGNSVQVRLYFTAAELASLIAEAGCGDANGCEDNDDVCGIEDLVATKYTSGSAPGSVGGLFLNQIGNGFDNDFMAHYVDFEVSSFSDIYLHGSESGVPLPVELLRFEAKAVDNKYVKLEWTTATEINNAGFDLERSMDGLSYTKIAWIEGHGTTNVLQNYAYEDMELAPGQYYYRLKQMDYDGQFEYSQVKAVKLKGLARYELSAFIPNPTKGESKLVFSTSEAMEVRIVITDLRGVIIDSKLVQLAEGIQEIYFDLSAYASGSYIASIRTKDTMETRKLIVTK